MQMKKALLNRYNKIIDNQYSLCRIVNVIIKYWGVAKW